MKVTPSIGGEQDQTVQLTLTGEPVVTTDAALYDEYENYFTEFKGDPGKPELQRPPPPFVVHGEKSPDPSGLFSRLRPPVLKVNRNRLV